ncbi:MAG: hypothetical protein ACRES6_02130, partial [Steroidobacteraceae bacterium]
MRAPERVGKARPESCRGSPGSQQRLQDALDGLAGVEPHDRGRAALRQRGDARLTFPPSLPPALAHARAIQDAQAAGPAGAETAVGQALFLQRVGDPEEPQVATRGERGPEAPRLLAQADEVADGEDLTSSR